MPAAPITLPTPTTAAAAAIWSRAQLTDRLYIVYFILLGALILLRRGRVEAWPAFLLCHVAGLALVAWLVANAARWPAAHAWYPVLLPLVTFPEIARLNLIVAGGWCDAPLLAAEAWLFLESPTFWLRRMTPPLVAELFQVGYLSYFLLLPIVAGVLRRRGEDAPFRGVIAASVLAYMLCYVAFLAVPMEGPVHTLRPLSGPPAFDGPFHALVRLVQRAGVHGNAFPSAHVAGALPPLIFACRYLPRLGAVMTLLVALMGVGAVYDGYHYASDVVAGAVVGAVAAAIVLAIQRSPAWTARLDPPAAADSVPTSQA